MTEQRDERDQPETGLISDEELPEDLRPTEDNPLAQDPDEQREQSDEQREPKVEGMPDMGQPGPA